MAKKVIKKATVKNLNKRAGKRAAKGHDAIGSHEGYSLPMKKKK